MPPGRGHYLRTPGAAVSVPADGPVLHLARRSVAVDRRDGAEAEVAKVDVGVGQAHLVRLSGDLHRRDCGGGLRVGGGRGVRREADGGQGQYRQGGGRYVFIGVPRLSKGGGEDLIVSRHRLAERYPLPFRWADTGAVLSRPSASAGDMRMPPTRFPP